MTKIRGMNYVGKNEKWCLIFNIFISDLGVVDEKCFGDLNIAKSLDNGKMASEVGRQIPGG